jgi:hypothetical protein
MKEPKSKKKNTDNIKVRDLKPQKDPKGGLPPGPCGPRPLQPPPDPDRRPPG